MADEDLNTGAEAPEPPLEAQIKATALGEMAKSEDISAYAQERQDQALEEEGKQPVTAPEERVNRYQEALEQARQATDRTRQETGLNGATRETAASLEAQVEQAALAQEQDRAYEAEMSKREKQAADVALYTYRANQELELHPDYWSRVQATFTANPPTRNSPSRYLRLSSVLKSHGECARTRTR